MNLLPSINQGIVNLLQQPLTFFRPKSKTCIVVLDKYKIITKETLEELFECEIQKIISKRDAIYSVKEKVDNFLKWRFNQYLEINITGNMISLVLFLNKNELKTGIITHLIPTFIPEAVEEDKQEEENEIKISKKQELVNNTLQQLKETMKGFELYYDEEYSVIRTRIQEDFLEEMF